MVKGPIIEELKWKERRKKISQHKNATSLFYFLSFARRLMNEKGMRASRINKL